MKICKGDLLESKDDVMVQQCNCVTIKAHGLSETISKRYPYANIYSKRISKSANRAKTPETPGTCIISQQFDKPFVAALLSQICPGKPGQWCKVYDIDPKLDDAASRLKYFKSSLKDLLSTCIKENWKSVSFPFKIGCGLAGGNWLLYFELIKEFELQGREFGITVTIWKNC
jgi:O-acetyl-ADP-ribose deacetylase (regulator of RNase III)